MPADRVNSPTGLACPNHRVMAGCGYSWAPGVRLELTTNGSTGLSDDTPERDENPETCTPRAHPGWSPPVDARSSASCDGPNTDKNRKEPGIELTASFAPEGTWA